MKYKHGRIKPKAYKNKAYLNYMHNSDKTCTICGSSNIELHHIKAKHITGRNDSKVVPLCPEHHRGRFSPHGADAKEFHHIHPKELLERYADEHFQEWMQEEMN